MSTQTEKSPAQLAEEFLRKYATVIGTLDAIKEKDRKFLLKYATVVGSPAAIDLVAPETDPTSVISDDETPEVPVVPPTDPTDPEDEGTETGDIGGEGMEDEGVENE